MISDERINEYLEEQFGDKDESVKENLAEMLFFQLGEAEILMDKSQSPIEQKLGIHLFRELNDKAHNIGYCTLKAQQKITVPEISEPSVERNYIVDFLLTFQTTLRSKEKMKFVIECDGHEYHERTKEQAKKDRKRDRLMAYQGYEVLRFTGAEIHEDAPECAREVICRLADLEERLRGFRKQ